MCHFSQKYLLYFKEKWCPAAGKDPLLGHVDCFQIDPNILVGETTNFCDFSRHF